MKPRYLLQKHLLPRISPFFPSPLHYRSGGVYETENLRRPVPGPRVFSPGTLSVTSPVPGRQGAGRASGQSHMRPASAAVAHESGHRKRRQAGQTCAGAVPGRPRPPYEQWRPGTGWSRASRTTGTSLLHGLSRIETAARRCPPCLRGSRPKPSGTRHAEQLARSWRNSRFPPIS